MNPLKRNNPNVRATEHEDRIQALERRIVPEPYHNWAFISQTTDQEIGAGTTENLAIDTFSTNDPDAFFTMPNGTAGDIQLNCTDFGFFTAILITQWEDLGAAYAKSCSIFVARLTEIKFSDFGPSAPTHTETDWTPTGAPINPVNMSYGLHSAWDFLPTQPAQWQMQATNSGASAADVTFANMYVLLHPIDPVTDEQDHLVY